MVSPVRGRVQRVFSFLLLLLLLRALPPLADAILELLPQTAVQPVAQLAEVVHLAPAVATPFAAGHVDEEVPLALLVVHALDAALLRFVSGLQ